MLRYSIMILGLICCNMLYGQLNIGGQPYSIRNKFTPTQSIPSFVAPSIDRRQLDEEDKIANENGLAPRFGKKFAANLNPDNSGLWSDLPNGDRLWQLEIVCPGALSINLIFEQFWLPPGTELYIYGKDKKHILGGFTNKNNKGNITNNIRGFGTGLVYSDDIIVEYYEPANTEKVALSISKVIHGYRYIKIPESVSGELGIGDSGPCQVNVNCSPEGDNWQKEKTGVAMVIVNGGDSYCTGCLINNTCRDGDLLFLTAEHCTKSPSGADNITPDDPNADNWTFMWLHESPYCTPTIMNLPNIFLTNGATMLAESDHSDFALFRLSESPLEENPTIMFNGWSRSTSLLSGGVGIHHPRGDAKKISTHTMVPASAFINYWKIFWDATANGHSVTEPGSSGSPLFMKNGLVIGQLRGSTSSNPDCSDPANDDAVYGKISSSWATYSDITKQLKHWLDPCGTGQTYVNGGFMANNCVADLYVTTPVIHNRTFQATDHIYASSKVPVDIAAEMYAGGSVSILPGFYAERGSNFLAHIMPCQPNTVLRLAQTEQNQANENLSATNNLTTDVYSLYPNPASDQITIRGAKGLKSAVLKDISGRIVAAFQPLVNETEQVFKLPEIKAGIYFLTLTDESGKTEIKKIAIEK